MERGNWTEERESRVALLVLGAGMAMAAGLLLWEGRNLTFFVDEWSFGYLFRPGLGPSELFEPDNGHLAALPILLTKASLELFGAETTLPIRLVSVSLHLGIAAMVFVFWRRWLGPMTALFPALLFLFLGAASEAFVGSQSIPVQTAAAAGIGALLALGSRSGRGDVLAAALLVVGVLSNGFVLPFVVGGAVMVLVESPSRRSRLWVFAPAVLIYAAWWLGYGHDADSGFAIDNVGGLPVFAFDSLAAALAAVTGLFTDPGLNQKTFVLGPGQALAGACLVAMAVLVVSRGYRPPRAAIPALVALLALWIATGLVAGPARQPAASRYVYSSVALLLIAAAPIVAASPERRKASIALALTFSIALLPNIREIHYMGNFFRTQASLNRAVLGAIDLTAAPLAGEQKVELPEDQITGGYDDMRSSISAYREARERFGTPAYGESALAGADPGARETADKVLARILGLEIERAIGPSLPLPAGLPITANGAVVERRGGCIEASAAAPSASVVLGLPPAGIRIRSGTGAGVPVALRRFGDGFGVDAGVVPTGVSADLRPAPDPTAGGWEVQLAPQRATVICGIRTSEPIS